MIINILKNIKLLAPCQKRDHFARAVFVLIVWGGSMIDTERINTQLSLSCEKATTTVDPGGD